MLGSSFQSILKVNVIARFRDVYKYQVVLVEEQGEQLSVGPRVYCMLAAGLGVINLWQ